RYRLKIRINYDLVYGAILGGIIVAALYLGARFVTTEVGVTEIGYAFWLGFLTLLRVAVLLLFATLIWTPIGVAIGFNPRLARIAQPIALLCASFPADFIFPDGT